jgi:hypothetical protein
MKFTFHEDDSSESSFKYKVGDEITPISDIEDFTLTIAFDYISVINSNLCFDYSKIDISDYQKLFKFKKEISGIPIVSFLDDSETKRKYHFHSIDLYRKKFLIEPLKQLLGYNKYIEVHQLPTIYQIGVYTDNTTMKAPRVLGFFGKNAIFHLLWFDYEHSIYPTKL